MFGCLAWSWLCSLESHFLDGAITSNETAIYFYIGHVHQWRVVPQCLYSLRVPHPQLVWPSPPTRTMFTMFSVRPWVKRPRIYRTARPGMPAVTEMEANDRKHFCGGREPRTTFTNPSPPLSRDPTNPRVLALAIVSNYENRKQNRSRGHPRRARQRAVIRGVRRPEMCGDRGPSS